VSSLEFTRVDPGHAAWRSPLRRALANAPTGIRDVTAEATDALAPAAGVAGLELEGEHAAQLLARLTELDLEALPATGAVAEVRMLLERPAQARFRIWFGQELSDYVAEAVLDIAEGLGWE
jgi:sarcosine oxidase gamma subunit